MHGRIGIRRLLLQFLDAEGGRYNYYRCASRLYRGNNTCDAPNIPKEELDAIVLDTVARTVLDPDRIEIMLNEMRNRIAEIQKPDRDKEKTLQRESALLTEQINNWYDMVEANKVELHQTLIDRLTAMQKQVDAKMRELSEIAKRRQIPLRKFGESQIQAFSEAVRSEILSKDSKFARSYLKAVVSEIRISGTTGTIKGNNADMAAAISSYRARAPLVVPRYVSNWCRLSDSN